MSLLQKNRFIYFFVFMCCLSSCHDKEALRAALVEQTIKERIENNYQKKKRNCAETVRKEALKIADSLMIAIALSKVDTSAQLNRPNKPSRPKVDLPTDTTPIKPLFKDSLISQIDTTTVSEN